MEYVNSEEVIPTSLPNFVENLNVLKQRFEDRTQCANFFNRFPFYQLLNKNMTDSLSIKACVKIVDFITDYEEFYKSDMRFNEVLEFILLGLTQISTDCCEINDFFKMLSKILWRHTKTLHDSLSNIFDTERILKLLVKMAEFQTVYESHFMFYTPILNRLLDEDFPDSLHCIICELFQKFEQRNEVKEQTNICKILLKRNSKFLCGSLMDIWEWLSGKCSTILLEGFYSNDETLLEDLIYCLITFEANWKTLNQVDKYGSCNMSDFSKKVYMKLNGISSDICLKTSNPRLRCSCIKLLEFLLNEFFVEELVSCPGDILQQIENFDVDVNRWPSSNQDIFFCICNLCIRYSRMLWNKSEVIQAMKLYFNSHRYSTKKCTLKSIFFLYPLLTDGDVDFYTRTLGDQLLYYFEQLSTVSELYSYNMSQLKWILNTAPRSLKMMALCQWLTKSQNNESCEQILIETIKICNAGTTVLHLILDMDFGKKFGLKAALLLRRLKNPQISRCITFILHKTVHRPVNFYNLLLAEPIPELDFKKTGFLCALMGAVLPSFIDHEILKNACKFSTKLLGHNRDNKSAIEKFCLNETNIHHLLRFIDRADDNTAVEIIRLLKLVVLLTHRHKLKMAYSISDGFISVIKGSQEKVEIGLRFLYHTLAAKHSLIVLDLGRALETYQLVLDCALNPVLQFNAYECTTMLLKRLPWLAQTMSTRIHIEMACLSFSDLTNSQSLLKMLDVWLGIIRKEPYNGFCPIPESAIKSFVKRVKISENQLKGYIETVDYLRKRESYQVKNRRNIFYTNILT